MSIYASSVQETPVKMPHLFFMMMMFLSHHTKQTEKKGHNSRITALSSASWIFRHTGSCFLRKKT